MRSASTKATTAAAIPSRNASWNPAASGIPVPLCTLDDASTAPITAAAVLVPSDRHRALSPLEAPVSFCGTERMMSMGIAA